jgi:PAS domain S-box-containing protein
MLKRIVSGKPSTAAEFEFVKKDGSRIFVEISSIPIGEGDSTEIVAVVRDITERKQVEETLRESEERYHAFFEQAPDSIVLVDAETGELVEFNDRAHQNLSYTREEFQKLKLEDFEVIESAQKVAKHIQKVVKQGGDTFETKHRTKAGDIRDVSVSCRAISIRGKHFVQSMWRDITEEKRAQEEIKATLKEKELLLKEIHHRVKNNLQVVSSLLYLQSEHIKDEQSLATIKESQNRVKSMALVHEQLYQPEGLARVNFTEYIRNLATYLLRSYGVNPDAITLKINADDVSLGIDTAIPCGLIINELVSNSVKHAFPAGKARGDRESEIRIDLHADDSKLTLTVSDNGVGLPGDLDFRNTESLGLHLVNTLTRQLEGTIELDRSGGTAFEITFAEL